MAKTEPDEQKVLDRLSMAIEAHLPKMPKLEDLEPLFKKLEELVKERNKEADRIRNMLSDVELRLNVIAPRVYGRSSHDHTKAGITYTCVDGKWMLRVRGKPIKSAEPNDLVRLVPQLPQLLEALCREVASETASLRR